MSDDDSAAAVQIGTWLRHEPAAAQWYERLLLLDAVDIRQLHQQLRAVSTFADCGGAVDTERLRKSSLKQLESIMTVQGLSYAKGDPAPKAKRLKRVKE